MQRAFQLKILMFAGLEIIFEFGFFLEERTFLAVKSARRQFLVRVGVSVLVIFSYRSVDARCLRGSGLSQTQIVKIFVLGKFLLQEPWLKQDLLQGHVPNEDARSFLSWL